MLNLRQKSKNYAPSWVVFNQPLNIPQSERLKPNVLIVADELFMSHDSLLEQKTRFNVPSAFRDCKPGQSDRNDKQKSKEAW